MLVHLTRLVKLPDLIQYFFVLFSFSLQVRLIWLSTVLIRLLGFRIRRFLEYFLIDYVE